MLNGIGPLEIVIVLAIALLVLGPQRLPQAGRSLGQGLRELRRGLSATDTEEAPAPAAPASREPA